MAQDCPSYRNWGRLAFLLALLGSHQVAAQGTGCLLQPTGSPPRQVIRCGGGLTIEAAAEADYTLTDHSRDGSPNSVILRSGALLVNTPPRRDGRPFQIRTPQAIAAVRGTEWAVDVAGAKTAVFVFSGRVSVRGPNGPAVGLRSGQGVDVEAGAAAPLQVKSWPAQRVAALVARFGR